MDQGREKFQELLRELFQFDCADLDFGIYRIMNYKRGVIEEFIRTDLPKAVADELNSGALADQSQAAQELAEVAKQIAESFGRDALDADGRLSEAYQHTPLGKRYLAGKDKAADGRGRQALEAAIFNHLYAFFGRYYQDGDFISKRRYSKRQRYAIPYNGEEVCLHWANRDQYYIKTAEHFHDYSFTAGGVTVHFKIKVADVEQNNVKGDARLFVPLVTEIEWNDKTSQLVIPFAYRPLTEQEAVTYGAKNGRQEKIINEAAVAIPKRLGKADKALMALAAEWPGNRAAQPVSFLAHHLRQYTRRNTSDFFIHKDLKEFLDGELDFYLKNEVLNLDEMEAAGEDRSEGWFQIVRVIKSVGGRIIDFLAQIESFQKMHWEKRKFVVETQYCIAVGAIDESFYPEIAACAPQWAEWTDLLHIDEEHSDLFTGGKTRCARRIAFLNTHPTLMLDTRYLSSDMVDRLLAAVPDLDAETAGLLVHSENYQALNLLSEKYRRSIKCICIDPPYNIGGEGDDGFIYKDNYQHSSWLSMLENRLVEARACMMEDGWLFINIDEREYHRLIMLLERVFGANVVTTITVKMSHLSGMKMAHTSIKPPKIKEYMVMVAFDSSRSRVTPEYEKTTWKEVTGNKRYNSYRVVDPNNPDDCSRWRRITIREALAHDHVDPNDSQAFEDWVFKNANNVFRTAVNDAAGIADSEKDGVFREVVSARGLRKIILNAEEVIYASSLLKEIDGESVPAEILGDIWTDIGINNLHNEGGVQFQNGKKPLKLIERAIRLAGTEGHIILDFFAGSGTTGHAVIRQNRVGGQEARKFILVEMEKYFDSATLPRIKKVAYTPEWKLDKPVRMATAEEFAHGPRIVKYIRLESYEDALNNIVFEDASGPGLFDFDDYLLKYMLKWETRKSATLLNVEQLARPFAYKLTVMKNGASFDQVVDVPETFNYLLGLHVETRKVYDDDGRRYLVYRGRINRRRIVVIWRDTDGWQQPDLERDKHFVTAQNMTDSADEVFVNGDSFIPGARALESVFKARMFQTAEA